MKLQRVQIYFCKTLSHKIVSQNFLIAGFFSILYAVLIHEIYNQNFRLSSEHEFLSAILKNLSQNVL